MATGKKLILGVVLDGLLLVTVFIPSLVCEFGHIEPFQRGFFCDDDSIKYPYKDNTVSVWAVAVVGISVPSVVIIIVEYLHWRYPRGSMMDKPPGYQLTPTFSVPGFVFISYKLIGTFLFGAAVTHSSTDTIKFSVGRLRPHFLAVCRPNITAGLCDSHVPGIYVYVDNFTCTGPKDHALHDSRLSFLSGHTAMSAYFAIFFVLYIQARLTWSGSRLLRHFLQAITMYLTLWVSMSRISDYKHHWSDVLAAAILGTLMSCLTGHHVSYLFRRSSYLPASKEQLKSDVVMLNVEGADMAEAGGRRDPG